MNDVVIGVDVVLWDSWDVREDMGLGNFLGRVCGGDIGNDVLIVCEL